MAKLTQAEVKAKADEWVNIGREIEKKEAALNAALDPFLVEYNEKTRPVRAKFEKKINSLREQRDEIEEIVKDWLTAQGKAIVIESDLAVAANELVVGKRTINVQKFFDRVKEKNAAFWDCVSVGIAKAEKLLGTTAVDEISTKEARLTPSLKRK